MKTILLFKRILFVSWLWGLTSSAFKSALRTCSLKSSSHLQNQLSFNFHEEGLPFSPWFKTLLNFHRTLELDFEKKYKTLSKIKCPFFRRRATDLLDNSAMIIAFLVSRHKSLKFLPELQIPGCANIHNQANNHVQDKTKFLPLHEIATIILNDWGGGMDKTNGKGYYITGVLNSTIYRDDCMFDGPDPDMPVRGLRKYLSAASHLFDRRSSRADPLSLKVDPTENTVTVSWRLEGVLNLPWHPRMKPFTGRTKYYLGPEGLVERHVEEWDIHVLDAFAGVLLPWLELGAPPAPPTQPLRLGPVADSRPPAQKSQSTRKGDEE